MRKSELKTIEFNMERLIKEMVSKDIKDITGSYISDEKGKYEVKLTLERLEEK